MRLLKALLPVFLVTAVAVYVRMNFSQLTESLASALQYLPILLVVFAVIICLHFNQLQILIFVLILTILYLALEYQWLNSELKLMLLASYLPIVLIVTVMFPKQSIMSVRALPLYLFIALLALYGLWLLREQPQGLLSFIDQQWLPQQYFEWTKILQFNLTIFLLSSLFLFAQLILKQNSQSATAFAIVIILIVALQITPKGSDLMLLTTAGLLLCLISVLQASWQMAYLDELTQLPGRRALQEKLQSLVGIYTLAMVDVDFFKKFNDSYGHDIGDEVLRMIAAQLKKISGGGTCYRFGGEEFTVVFANKSVDQAQVYLEEVRENIANTAFVVNRRNTNSKSNNKTKSVSITVSIGACDSIAISSSQEVLKQADKALYKAKKKGRNCLVLQK